MKRTIIAALAAVALIGCNRYPYGHLADDTKNSVKVSNEEVQRLCHLVGESLGGSGIWSYSSSLYAPEYAANSSVLDVLMLPDSTTSLHWRLTYHSAKPFLLNCIAVHCPDSTYMVFPKERPEEYKITTYTGIVSIDVGRNVHHTIDAMLKAPFSYVTFIGQNDRFDQSFNDKELAAMREVYSCFVSLQAQYPTAPQ